MMHHLRQLADDDLRRMQTPIAVYLQEFHNYVTRTLSIHGQPCQMFCLLFKIVISMSTDGCRLPSTRLLLQSQVENHKCGEDGNHVGLGKVIQSISQGGD